MNWKIVIETDRKNCPWRTKYIYQDKRNEYLCDKEITTEDTKCTKKNCPYRKGEWDERFIYRKEQRGNCD